MMLLSGKTDSVGRIGNCKEQTMCDCKSATEVEYNAMSSSRRSHSDRRVAHDYHSKYECNRGYTTNFDLEQRLQDSQNNDNVNVLL